MAFPLEYHVLVKRSVQRSISASLALFGVLLLPLFLVSSSPAQISATSSAASSGGGHASSGGAPSMTSPGRSSFAPPTAGFAPPTGAFAPPTAGFTPPTAGVNSHNHGFPNTNHHHHHAAYGDIYYPYVYAVPVPYAADANDSNSDDDDSEYQGGPTIFDRRGSGAASYVPPSDPGPAHQAVQAENAPPIADPAPEPPQPPTTLVFKDGHQLEIANYAIVSQTLYDLTPGHPRKIALADLDIPATEKQNDDNGVTFALPPSAQAN
jgi:hypothetical protein